MLHGYDVNVDGLLDELELLRLTCSGIAGCPKCQGLRDVFGKLVAAKAARIKDTLAAIEVLFDANTA